MLITGRSPRYLLKVYYRRLKANLLWTLIIAVVSAVSLADAEPWLDTRDSALRVDIERLSNAGIIKVPINTRPLMWSGLINDLEITDSKALPKHLMNSFSRVKSAAKKATRINNPYQSVKLSAANESQLFRHFGDSAREQGELSLRRNAITEHFAYNLEINKTLNAWDDENTHYDNSYLGVIMGNWMVSFGSVERWWGPSWNSSLILTNNARPTPGLSLQRNYSDPFELPVLEWLGPWSTSIFISKLDDQRVIHNAKLVGMSVGFRPTQALEINLRRTAQWGGEGRPQSWKSFLELLTGVADNCVDISCKPDEPGNQLGGVDIRWDMPWLDASIYGQTIGEDEAGGLPSRRAYQIGMQLSFTRQWFEGAVFIEFDETSLRSAPSPFNSLYNHSIYRSGYRYEGRVLGATWDNDSQVTSIGAIGYLANGDKVEARYSFGDINRDSLDGGPSGHSISTVGAAFNTLSSKWQRAFLWGDLALEGRYTDQMIDEFGRQKDRLRVAASINYYFY